MNWQPYYQGNGVARTVTLADPPPWRTFPRASQHQQFQPPPGLVEAVNVALHLRRPLLITGAPGSGKSTVIEQVAVEMALGPVLRWHITSRSKLSDALYRYDALGRIHAQNLRSSPRTSTDVNPDASERPEDDIAPFLHLGPLGTALVPTDRPRALLIDEIDKSDLDLPSDLLEVLERGEFEIPELVRYREPSVSVRLWSNGEIYPVIGGRVSCTQFPFVVMTSNDEREFPPAFLRRCIRYTMPRPTAAILRQVLSAHLGMAADDAVANELVDEYLKRLDQGDLLSVDQLLNAVLLLHGEALPETQRRDLLNLLLHDLTDA